MKKLSGALAASLIVGQLQSVVLAESPTELQDIDANNEDLSQSFDAVANESAQKQLEDVITEEDSSETTEQEKETSEEVIVEDDLADEELSSIEEQVQEESTLDEEENVDVTLTQPEQEETKLETVGTPYIAKGKLELDLNFALPIKYTDCNTTDLTVTLKKGSEIIETIQLGSDSVSKKQTAYTLEALNSKRQPLSDNETDISFYHLTFEKLDLGTYTLEISGAGYKTATVQDIEIQSSIKACLTWDKRQHNCY